MTQNKFVFEKIIQGKKPAEYDADFRFGENVAKNAHRKRHSQKYDGNMYISKFDLWS